jgi:lipopolysaccharide export system protein LptA
VRDDVTVTASRVETPSLASGKNARVVATGGVRARNPQGQIRAAQVTWADGRAVASGNVTLSSDGNTLSGARLETDQEFRRAVLSGGVRGAIGTARVSARTLTWLRVQNGRTLPDNGRIEARGNVTLRREGVTPACRFASPLPVTAKMRYLLAASLSRDKKAPQCAHAQRDTMVPAAELWRRRCQLSRWKRQHLARHQFSGAPGG